MTAPLAKQILSRGPRDKQSSGYVNHVCANHHGQRDIWQTLYIKNWSKNEANHQQNTILYSEENTVNRTGGTISCFLEGSPRLQYGRGGINNNGNSAQGYGNKRQASDDRSSNHFNFEHTYSVLSVVKEVEGRNVRQGGRIPCCTPICSKYYTIKDRSKKVEGLQSLLPTLLGDKFPALFQMRHKVGFLFLVIRNLSRHSPIRPITFSSKNVPARPFVINSITIIGGPKSVGIAPLVTIGFVDHPNVTTTTLFIKRCPPIVYQTEIVPFLNKVSFWVVLQLLQSFCGIGLISFHPVLRWLSVFGPLCVIGITSFNILPYPNCVVPIEKARLVNLCFSRTDCQEESQKHDR